jgi:large subunit ribosomal protein L17
MTVIRRLFDEIAPKFTDREGGYTQIIKTSDYRIGDGGELVVLQLVTKAQAPTGTIRRSAGLRRKRNEKRQAFAAKLAKAAKGEPTAPAAASDETPAAT